MKKNILIAAVIIIVGLGVFLFWRSGNKNSDNPGEENNDMILFYGTGCPHCKIVEDYISENKVTEKIQFAQKEVYFNKSNAAIFKEKSAQCGIDEKNLGVPLLWAEGKCYEGDQNIVNYFKSKTGINNSN